MITTTTTTTTIWQITWFTLFTSSESRALKVKPDLFWFDPTAVHVSKRLCVTIPSSDISPAKNLQVSSPKVIIVHYSIEHCSYLIVDECGSLLRSPMRILIPENLSINFQISTTDLQEKCSNTGDGTAPWGRISSFQSAWHFTAYFSWEILLRDKWVTNTCT